MNGASLLAAVLDDPTDHVAKLILADWIEENGDGKRAWAWRWIASWGRVPGYEVEQPNYFWGCGGDEWKRESSQLPITIYMSLSMTSGLGGKYFYDGYEEAYEDLVQALVRARNDLRRRR